MHQSQACSQRVWYFHSHAVIFPLLLHPPPETPFPPCCHEQLPEGSCRGLQAAVSCGLVTCVAEVLRGTVDEGLAAEAAVTGSNEARESDESGEGEEEVTAVSGQKNVQMDAAECETNLEDWGSQEEPPKGVKYSGGIGDGGCGNDQDNYGSAHLSSGVGSDLEDDLLM